MKLPAKFGPITGMLAVNLAADIFAWCFVEDRWPQPPLVVWYSLIFSQVSLAAIWVGLGESHFVYRWLTAAAVLMAAIAALSSVRRNQPDPWVVLVSLQIAAIAGPLTIARWRGVRLRSEGNADKSLPDRQPMQFHLWHLWAGITCVGVLLGIGRALPWLTRWLDVGELIVIAGCFAIVALVGLWAALGTSRLPLRIILLILSSLAAGAVLSFIGGNGPDRFGVVVLTVLQMVFLAASLGVCRYCGYRLEGRGAGPRDAIPGL